MSDARYARDVTHARTLLKEGKATLDDFRRLMRLARAELHNRQKPYVLRLYTNERDSSYPWLQTNDPEKARREGQHMMRETRPTYLPGRGRRVIAYDVFNVLTGQLVTPDSLATAAD